MQIVVFMFYFFKFYLYKYLLLYMRIECTQTRKHTREYVNTCEAHIKFLRPMSSLNVIMPKGFVNGDFQVDSF